MNQVKCWSLESSKGKAPAR